MLDTNILISALIFPNEDMNTLIYKTVVKNQLVLSTYIIEELLDVIDRKFPKKRQAIETFLMQIPYELVYTPKDMDTTLFEIRDGKDYPVLYSAIIGEVDILITGDKDFENVEVEKPEIFSKLEFLSRY